MLQDMSGEEKKGEGGVENRESIVKTHFFQLL